MGDGTGAWAGHGYAADLYPHPHVREAPDREGRQDIASHPGHPHLVRVALRPLVTALMCTVRAFLLQHPNLKIGPNFRGPPALPPCCKASTLTPHPFIYGHLEYSQGVCRPNCEHVDT